MCITDAELLPMEFLHYADMPRQWICRDMQASIACVLVVDLFRSCDLDLDPTTFTYELDLYGPEIHRMCCVN